MCGVPQGSSIRLVIYLLRILQTGTAACCICIYINQLPRVPIHHPAAEQPSLKTLNHNFSTLRNPAPVSPFLLSLIMEAPNNIVHTGDGPMQGDPQQDGIPITHRQRNPECSESEWYQLFLHAKSHPEALQADLAKWFCQ